MASVEKRSALNGHAFAAETSNRSHSLSPSHKRIKSDLNVLLEQQNNKANSYEIKESSDPSFSLSLNPSISSSFHLASISFPVWSAFPSVLLSLSGSFLDPFSLFRGYRVCKLFHAAFFNEEAWTSSQINLIDMSAQPVKCHFEFPGEDRTINTASPDTLSSLHSPTSSLNSDHSINLPLSPRLNTIIHSILHVRHLTITSDTCVYLPTFRVLILFESLETLQCHFTYHRYKTALFPHLHELKPKHSLIITLYIDIKWSELHTLSPSLFRPDLLPNVTFAPHIHLRSFNGAFPHDGMDVMRQLNGLKGFDMKREGFWIQDEHFMLMIGKTDPDAEIKSTTDAIEDRDIEVLEEEEKSYYSHSVQSNANILSSPSTLPFPSLDTLSIAGQALTYRSISILSYSLPSLTSLTLTGVRSITAQIILLLPTISKLAILSISLNRTMDESLLLAVLRSISTLHTLDISLLPDGKKKKSINVCTALLPTNSNKCTLTSITTDFVHSAVTESNTAAGSSILHWKSGPYLEAKVESNRVGDNSSFLSNCRIIDLYLSSISTINNPLLIHLFTLPHLQSLILRRPVSETQTSAASSSNKSTSINGSTSSCHSSNNNGVTSVFSPTSISPILLKPLVAPVDRKSSAGWDRSDYLNFLFYLKSNFDWKRSKLRVLELDIEDDVLLLFRENMKCFCIRRIAQ